MSESPLLGICPPRTSRSLRSVRVPPTMINCHVAAPLPCGIPGCHPHPPSAYGSHEDRGPYVHIGWRQAARIRPTGCTGGTGRVLGRRYRRSRATRPRRLCRDYVRSLRIQCRALPSNLEAVVLPLALFYGGLAQLLAGMWEFRKANTFGALAFSSYGAFWLSFAAYVKFIAPGLPASSAGTATGLFLLAWTIFTAYMTVARAARQRRGGGRVRGAGADLPAADDRRVRRRGRLSGRSAGGWASSPPSSPGTPRPRASSTPPGSGPSCPSGHVADRSGPSSPGGVRQRPHQKRRSQRRCATDTWSGAHWAQYRISLGALRGGIAKSWPIPDPPFRICRLRAVISRRARSSPRRPTPPRTGMRVRIPTGRGSGRSRPSG